MTPNGRLQTLTLPLADFATRSNESLGAYDFQHFKDFTFVEMTPDVPFIFYRITLVGNCGANGGNNSSIIDPSSNGNTNGNTNGNGNTIINNGTATINGSTMVNTTSTPFPLAVPKKSNAAVIRTSILAITAMSSMFFFL
jgi:hypothetical protein